MIRAFLKIIVLIAVCSLFITAMKRFSKIEDSQSQRNIGSAMSFEDFDYTVYQGESAQKKMTLQGKRIDVTNKQLGVFQISLLKMLSLKDVEVTFYQENSPVSTVRAKKAIVEIPRSIKNISLSALQRIDFLEGGVVITEDKRILAADRIELDGEKNLLLAQGNCILRYDGHAVRAHKITTDVELKNFNVEQGKSKRRVEKLFKFSN